MAIRVLERLACCRTSTRAYLTFAGLPAPQAGRAVHGHDARNDVSPPLRDQGRAALGSPDKDPKVRLQVLEDAGRSNVAFTTGILIGIGETLEERA